MLAPMLVPALVPELVSELVSALSAQRGGRNGGARERRHEGRPVTTTPERLAHVKSRIAAAARAAGRDAALIHLVAVTKTFGADHIEPALACGQRCFGENRVQEARAGSI